MGFAPTRKKRLSTAHVESAGGAPALGSGGNSVTFAPGLNPASLTVFPPAAHRTGRAALPHPALQADHATRTRTTASPHGASPVQRLARSLFPLHALSPLAIRPVYALIAPRGVPGMPHGSFTFACDAAEVSDHLPVSRSLPMPWPLPLRTSLRTCGPFPPRALPRICGTTGHSATLSARPDPCGLPVGVCCTSDRASRVATPSILHACQCQYPGGNSSVHVSFTSRATGGLPLVTGGSASALHVSRPAQHSLRVPACMLAESPM